MNLIPCVFVTSQRFEVPGQHSFGACIKGGQPNVHQCTQLQLELADCFRAVAREARITALGDCLFIFIRVGADAVDSNKLMVLCRSFGKLLIKHGFATEVIVASPFPPNRVH